MPAASAAKGELLKVRDVAKILNYGPKYVVKLIDLGRLSAVDLSEGQPDRKRRTLRVEASSVRRFRAAQAARGRND